MITLRRAVAADAQGCARILHEAFVGIATQYGFPASVHSLVAESGGRVAGVVFLDEGDPIAGVAAIAVDPALQGQGIGRRLMRAALLAGVAASLRAPLAFLVPTRQAGLFRWCLDEGLRVEKPLTLMAMGEYRAPQGGWFPSGIY
jgi:GNAT superfamily N-acetyltransferase